MCSAATAVIGRVSVFCDKGTNASARPAKLRACAPNDSQIHAVLSYIYIHQGRYHFLQHGTWATRPSHPYKEQMKFVFDSEHSSFFLQIKEIIYFESKQVDPRVWFCIDCADSSDLNDG